MALADDRSRSERGGIDDETVALVLRLHREPKANGARRTAREIAAECRKQGRPCNRDKVSQLIRETHAETIGAATSETREKIAGALDVNLTAAEKARDALLKVGLTGSFDDGTEAPPAQRVAALRECGVIAMQLMGTVGVTEAESNRTPEQIGAELEKLFGAAGESNATGTEVSAVSESLAH